MITLIIVMFVTLVIIAALLEIVAFTFDWLANALRWLLGGAGECVLIIAIVMLLITSEKH